MQTKIIAGYIVKNEAEMLSRVLPNIHPHIDGIVAVVDSATTDQTESILKAFGATVILRPWSESFCAARNACIALAEQHWPAPSHCFTLDGDECLTGRDFIALREFVNYYPHLAISIPRYEFVDDLFHFNPSFYPDYQTRIFPMHSGYHYRGIIHEQLYCGQDEKAANVDASRGVIAPFMHIFHYGKCKPMADVWLKYENYRRISAGEPLLQTIPEGVTIPESFSHGVKIRFTGERPL